MILQLSATLLLAASSALAATTPNPGAGCNGRTSLQTMGGSVNLVASLPHDASQQWPLVLGPVLSRDDSELRSLVTSDSYHTTESSTFNLTNGGFVGTLGDIRISSRTIPVGQDSPVDFRVGYDQPASAFCALLSTGMGGGGGNPKLSVRGDATGFFICPAHSAQTGRSVDYLLWNPSKQNAHFRYDAAKCKRVDVSLVPVLRGTTGTTGNPSSAPSPKATGSCVGPALASLDGTFDLVAVDHADTKKMHALLLAPVLAKKDKELRSFATNDTFTTPRETVQWTFADGRLKAAVGDGSQWAVTLGRKPGSVDFPITVAIGHSEGVPQFCANVGKGMGQNPTHPQDIVLRSPVLSYKDSPFYVCDGASPDNGYTHLNYLIAEPYEDGAQYDYYKCRRVIVHLVPTGTAASGVSGLVQVGSSGAKQLAQGGQKPDWRASVRKHIAKLNA